MNLEAGDYFRAARHPWACVCFVLPLLLVYEASIVILGAHQPEVLRNGADTWLRWSLSRVGLDHSFWPGAFVGLGLLCWAWWHRHSQPRELFGVGLGMAVESGVFAVGLWALSQAVGRLLSGVQLPLALEDQPEPALQHVVSFLGAGIYEEVLFRLLLLSLLHHFFRLGDLSRLSTNSLAVGLSALLFAAAHHLGSAGEPFDGAVFLFRTLAGIYFALLVKWRGLGVAVGTHAGYDVLVGVVLPGL